MNHQPFREWLLTDEQLSTEQSRALQDHLSSCESCSQMRSSWTEVELAIRRYPQVAPDSGFTLRWQDRLVEYQSLQQSRRGWMTIGAATFIAACLLVVMITQIWALIEAPGPYLAVWLDRLVSVASVYFVLQNIVSTNSWYFLLYMLIGMFFFVGLISFMSVLWLVAYRKLSLARRFV